MPRTHARVPKKGWPGALIAPALALLGVRSNRRGAVDLILRLGRARRGRARLGELFDHDGQPSASAKSSRSTGSRRHCANTAVTYARNRRGSGPASAMRRRIRRGTIQAEKESEPPYRWMVAVPGDARTDVGPPPGVACRCTRSAERGAHRGHEVMRRELTVLHETLRHERSQAERLAVTFEQAMRALPAPQPDPLPRCRWRWPWRR